MRCVEGGKEQGRAEGFARTHGLTVIGPADTVRTTNIIRDLGRLPASFIPVISTQSSPLAPTEALLPPVSHLSDR